MPTLTRADILTLMQDVLLAIAMLFALAAPVFGSIHLKRNHIRRTRRSMLLAALAYECLAAGALCIAGGVRQYGSIWQLWLTIAAVVAMPTCALVLLLADRSAPREPPALN